jgi:riboflavin kinase/FMN adenylyltransferase
MGKDRSGGFEELTAAGEARGFRVVRVGPTLGNGEPISSSRIRELIASGSVREAAGLLGHPYLVEGTVVAGRGIGRTLHFPTANADVEDTRKLLPKFGVYAVHVRILSGDEKETSRPGVMNLGVRPTFGTSEPVLEVHLPKFEGDLLGKRLALELVERIREERAFDGPEALAARIEEDVEEARKILEDF